ncbi:hypothetical protein [Novilysobacter spongiicola]|uniref:hypothetical protein n=1 Tax=Novilysobacter spongiicola TaxID=435289 RepID=UPI0013565170|nr:hypothetical protein [Lysobacter spongiicola]
MTESSRFAGSNNSFKPKPLRYTKGMAEKACHAFGSTTRFGLTQALGLGGKMVWLAKFSTALAIFGFSYVFVLAIIQKTRKRDMPRARGLGLILFCCGLGQWAVFCLGVFPYISGQGVSLSRHLKYFSAASDPTAALTGILVHVSLGLFLSCVGLYFGLKLLRHGTLAKA